MVDQREELLRLHGGNPLGKVPAASHGIIIKLFFVSFVLFVVIFLSRFNLYSLWENVQRRVRPKNQNFPLLPARTKLPNPHTAI